MLSSVIAVPGVRAQSPEVLRRFLDICERHQWDPDAIAAVISRESGWRPDIKNSAPGQTGSGLLQWIEKTAQAMFGLSAATIRTMSVLQQLDLVERWYLRTLGAGPHQPVDYYKVGAGAPANAGPNYVIAASPSKLYSLNSSLDADKDGRITVSDLGVLVAQRIASAKGVRVDVPPLAAAPELDQIPTEPEIEARPSPGSSLPEWRLCCLRCRNYDPQERG